MSRIQLHNTTSLSNTNVLGLCRDGLAGWAVGSIRLYLRYSRGADYSGSCFYADRRIFINLGRHLEYPYLMGTNLARAIALRRRWFRPIHRIRLESAYQVVLFVFLHELYHLLVKRAGRNTRQKEGRCDRFAARFLVDRFGATVHDTRGRPVPRDEWDFQELEGFVDAARDRHAAHRPLRRQTAMFSGAPSTQLLLFPL